MNILLTNDDGIFAPGLIAIHKRLTRLGEVTTAAPLDCRSGASHSITFAEPLTCTRVSANGITGYGVNGSPADCVKLASMQLLDQPIDLIVSGINNGANVGINVYYSGTVAAALEGAFLNIPAIALSLASDTRMDFEAAADYGIALVKQCLPMTAGMVLNVNVPRLTPGRPKGIRVVPQSTQGFHEYYVPHENISDHMAFQLTGGPHQAEKPQTDTMLLSEGYVTITPLRADMTHHEQLIPLADKLACFCLENDEEPFHGHN